MADLNGGFDIIINGTSGGLSGQLPAVNPEIFRNCRLAYDMVYGEAAQAFLTLPKATVRPKFQTDWVCWSVRLPPPTIFGVGFTPDIRPVIEYMKAL